MALSELGIEVIVGLVFPLSALHSLPKPPHIYSFQIPKLFLNQNSEAYKTIKKKMYKIQRNIQIFQLSLPFGFSLFTSHLALKITSIFFLFFFHSKQQMDVTINKVEISNGNTQL